MEERHTRTIAILQVYGVPAENPKEEPHSSEPEGQEAQPKDRDVKRNFGTAVGPWDDFVWLETFQT